MCEEFYCRSFLPAVVRLHNSISSSGPHTKEYKYLYYCVDVTSASIDNDVIFLCMVFVKKQKKFLKMMTDEMPCMTSNLDVPGNGVGFYHRDREKAEGLVRKQS